MTDRLPALFLGHGSPMTVISDVPERRALAALGKVLPAPRAILCITAHWETRGSTHVTSQSLPRTIHDFRGFPQELYDIVYPAPGSSDLVDRIDGLLGAGRLRRDREWGFDHGVWGVLQPIYPGADIPVVAMSLDMTLPMADHLALGAALAPLRDEGVLVVGSGNIIHNLSLWRASVGTQPEWAVDFRARSNAAILSGDDDALVHFAAEDRAATLAINSAEHYLPLLYVMGARLPSDTAALFNDTLDGSLSMTSVMLGADDLVNRLKALP